MQSPGSYPTPPELQSPWVLPRLLSQPASSGHSDTLSPRNTSQTDFHTPGASILLTCHQEKQKSVSLFQNSLMSPRYDISTWVPHRYLELTRTKLNSSSSSSWRMAPPSIQLPMPEMWASALTALFLTHDVTSLTVTHCSHQFYLYKGPFLLQ